MTVSEISLEKAKEIAKTKVFRASDFLTEEQVEEVHKSNYEGKKRSYNAVDAYVAEIIARFGFDTYMAWKNGEISEDLMMRYVKAERARDAIKLLPLETIIITAMAGANNATKQGHAPKSLKTAIKVLKIEENKAKGEF